MTHQVLFVTRSTPNAVGRGDMHRSYQIQHDIECIADKENVITISSLQWQQERSKNAWWSDTPPKPIKSLHFIPQAIRKSLSKFVNRPQQSLESLLGLKETEQFQVKGFVSPGFIQHYKSSIESISAPKICVIDDVRFAELVSLNSKLNIPTLCCIHNLESFDSNIGELSDLRNIQEISNDFAEELRILSQCHRRLFISKVETAIINGLGLPSSYYPYLPVGEIRNSLETIRKSRAKSDIASGIFLMLGSVLHTTTGESFKWFIENAKKHTLPENTRIIVGGSGVDNLKPEVEVPGLEFRDWIDQEELDVLLSHVTAVLAPQLYGFGALTRLSEMSCAGIPVITSKHPMYAVDPIPGVIDVEDDWGAWCKAMTNLVECGFESSDEDYSEWEKKQPNPLRSIIEEILAIEAV